jgi:hypothetical protein
MERTMIFAPDAFRALVNALREAGYSFRSFGDPPGARALYLRHDIDFSLEFAAQMAREEHALGVTSTYFVMLTSNAYNLISVASRRLVEEIMSLGHVVTLHFDPVVHDDIDAGFRREAAILEGITGRPLEVVSLHRPGAFLKDNNRRLPGVRHTYEDAYFRDMKYISDSGGAFKYGPPLESEAFRNGDPIHLLLHPIWWMTDPGSPSDKVRSWQERAFAFLNDEAKANCLTFDGRSVLKS